MSNSLYAMKIGTSSTPSTVLTPPPLSIKPSDNSLDSEKSGRDNNTGLMFRDKIAEKLKYTVEMPAGMTNAQVSAILAIILAPSFYAEIPNVKTGAFERKQFYCSGCDPEIDEITTSGYQSGSWTYKEWSFNMTEM